MLRTKKRPGWRLASLVFMIFGPFIGVVVSGVLKGSFVVGIETLLRGLIYFAPLFILFVYLFALMPALAALIGFLFARRYENIGWYLFFSAGGGVAPEVLIKSHVGWFEIALPAVTASLCTLITLAIARHSSELPSTDL